MRRSRRNGQCWRTVSWCLRLQLTISVSSPSREASAWQTAQRAHAIANGVYVAAVNRVGLEKPAGSTGDGIEFWGGSFVADPFGVVMKEASRTEEETLIVTCDRRHQETVRQHWPFLRDRRIDAYAGVTRRLIDE